MVMDIFEVMDTCRALRRLKPDPVPEELVRKMVHAATRAPSPGNSQLWGFLVITEPEDREFLAGHVREGMAAFLAQDPPPQDRMMRSVRYLVEHFAEVPVFILPAIQNGYPVGSPRKEVMWSAIYPATQNLLLAARALGLGAPLTTFQRFMEPAIRERFGVPEDVFFGALIPVGYPIDKFGPVRRKPVEEVIHWGRWGEHR